MPKQRNEKSIKAEELYRQGWKLVDIAKKLGVPSGTVRRWKSNYNWDGQSERSDKIKVNVRKRGGQPNNKNATGLPGNTHAVKHGLFAKYLPQEVFGIVKELEEKQPIDILWENITLTYANLLHAQRILFVENKEDSNVYVTSQGDNGISYEHQTAWDKQGRSFAAIARIQGELRQMIKTYDEMTRSDLITEEQRLRIDSIKAKLGNDNVNRTESALDEYLEKLGDNINGTE
ncbi:phage terminase small subunit [Streptococcus sp. sy010]|uniref:phage terminase small subunit n=1 Tax=Streptococcus sp. sy010 TaxID=2600148 RepID=UPI0021BDDB44|nr:phage terminase small subunit [Streptococcus sp. sy010]